MNYQSFTLCDDLSDLVKCYWTLDGPADAESVKQRIIPDGCMEMIFHYGDPYKQYMTDGSTIIQPRCFIFGQITRPLEIEATGHTGIFGVRFRPDGFSPFAMAPLQNLENRAVPIEEMFGEQGKRFGKSVLRTHSMEKKIELTQKFLLAKRNTSKTKDLAVRETVNIIFQLKGQVFVKELAGKLHVHQRQMERKFSAAIGISPKQLSKIFRLNAVLKKMVDCDPCITLASLAEENGYYDQSHFITDFKEFAGISPKHFYANNLRMSFLFAGTS